MSSSSSQPLHISAKKRVQHYDRASTAGKWIKRKSSDSSSRTAKKLKKTLTNAGLYPQPETGESRLKKRMTTGRMGVFANGDTSATLSKGTGDPM